MREIKFRGRISQCLENAGSWVYWGINGTDMLDSLDPDSIGQFTGRKDMDGVEMYENDIVLFTYWWFDGNIAESNLTGTIVYSDDLMSFQLKGVINEEWQKFTGYENDSTYLTPFSELYFEEADFKVIGNIYQHPELLSVGG